MYNNKKYNIINNNIIQDQNIPSKKFVRLLNYSNSDNFLSTAFGISIKKNVLKLKTGELNLNKNVNMKKSLINKDTNLNGIH